MFINVCIGRYSTWSAGNLKVNMLVKILSLPLCSLHTNGGNLINKYKRKCQITVSVTNKIRWNDYHSQLFWDDTKMRPEKKLKWDLNFKREQTLKVQEKRVADRENGNFKGPKMGMNLQYLRKRKNCTVNKGKHGGDELSRGHIR